MKIHDPGIRLNLSPESRLALISIGALAVLGGLAFPDLLAWLR